MVEPKINREWRELTRKRLKISAIRGEKFRLFGILHGRAKINRELTRINAKKIKNQCNLCAVWAGSAH